MIVQATVGTYTSAQSLTLGPAPFGHVSVTTSPLAFIGDASAPSAVALQVVVFPAAADSSLSQGTLVQFSIASTTPAGSEAIIEPDEAPLDAANTATASLLAAESVTSVVVNVNVVAADGTLLGPGVQPKIATIGQ